MSAIGSSAERIDRRAALRRGAMFLAGVFAVPAIGAIEACAPAEPRTIAYGRDQCAFCRMVVSEPRFAAALVSAKGRTFVFDSIECLAGFCLQDERTPAGAPARSLWVADSERPGTLIRVERARFLREEGPSSPMGKGLLAFSSAAGARGGDASATAVSWIEVLALMEREGLRPGAVSRSSSPARQEARATRG